MTAGLADYEWAQSTFAEASSAVGTDIFRLCADGPEEELAKTEYAQVAIFVTSYCLLRLAHERTGEVYAAAGHSLGEYTALAAAGAIEFSHAVALVSERASAMAEACEANPGGMSAILGADWSAIEDLCSSRRGQGGEIWAANQNAPGQSVVAGSNDDLDWLAEHGKEVGAKRVIRLSVSGAFHSPYMEPAAKRLAAALSATPVSGPAFTVWSNVTGRPHGSPEEIKALLAEQLTAPVRWTECVRGILESGANELVCLGPGDAIAGMVRRIADGEKIVRLETAEAAASAGPVEAAVEQDQPAVRA
ncbi:MAG: malonyl CoA-acyl carrier protein transacylase [Acidobacteria bacterium]|nr:MAG: malonyl CoA-acyl carrier protein transacylase [Acidobacteriota bacterium]